MQVIYPFIDSDTKGKFCFVPGNAKGEAAKKEFSKNFDVDQLEEVKRFLRLLLLWLFVLFFTASFFRSHSRVQVCVFVYSSAGQR